MKKSALKDHSQICLIFVLGHFVDKHFVFWVDVILMVEDLYWSGQWKS